MSSSKNKKRNASVRRAAQLAAQQRQERRRAMAIRGAVAVLTVIVVSLVIALFGRESGDDEADVATSASIDGAVVEFDVESASHVPNDVDYPQSPPVGGDHDQAWQTCGTYDEPVRDENAVHSMEHGAVWIAYSPDLDAAAIGSLQDRADGQTHVLVTPYEGDLTAPISLQAWGRQLAVDSADDERIATFIQDYQEGPDTPELGAPCSGGIGSPG